MKRMITILACILAILAPLSACSQDEFGPRVIAGAGVGVAIEGPDTRETFLTQYAGARIFTPRGASVYGCFQHGTIEGLGIGGNGAKVVLADRWRQLPDFTWLVGLGFLDNIKRTGDGFELKSGLTFEGGVSYDATTWIDIGLFGSAWERGKEPALIESKQALSVDEPRGGRVSWALMLLATIKDPQDLLPGFGD